jgi:hypothetical protein
MRQVQLLRARQMLQAGFATSAKGMDVPKMLKRHLFLIHKYDLITLYNFEEAIWLLFTTFRKNLRFGEAERAHIQ